MRFIRFVQESALLLSVPRLAVAPSNRGRLIGVGRSRPLRRLLGLLVVCFGGVRQAEWKADSGAAEFSPYPQIHIEVQDVGKRRFRKTH